jgi:4-hydroxymandelate oxidase
MDFEPLARRTLPPAHFGYLTTGVDDDATLRENHTAITAIHLRPRRLVGASTVDLRTELFGVTWESPLLLCPVGNQKAFHPEGEVAVARAANARHTLQILSTVTTSSLADVTAALGHPPWYQLYTTTRWTVAEELVRRAESAGCPALVLTVDTMAGRRTETLERFKREDKRDCAACHGTKPEDFFRRKPMFAGLDVTGLATYNPSLSWTDVRKLRDKTRMKLLIKGIVTREDAALCIENGADGIIVSNHGGRAEESGRATIECLPEVVDAVRGRVPVLIDGGFRRGTDIFKALALGARAVGVGRPYIWGLAAFGEAGVDRVIEMLRAELELVMKQCGTRSIADITPAHILLPIARPRP